MGAFFELGAGAACLGKIGLPMERRVVDGQLAVERHQIARRVERERIDLEQLGIPLAEEPVEFLQKCVEFSGDGGLESGRRQQSFELRRAQALSRVDHELENQLGALRMELFDFYASFRGKKESGGAARVYR